MGGVKRNYRKESNADHKFQDEKLELNYKVNNFLVHARKFNIKRAVFRSPSF